MSKPTVDSELPECPPHLGGEAKAEWERLVPLLAHRGILETVDRAALAAYCLCWSRHVDAEEKMGESGGPVVKSPTGYPIQNPWLAISNKALVLMKSYLSEFGLTPKARLRLLMSELPDLLPIPPGRHVFPRTETNYQQRINVFPFLCPACNHTQNLVVAFGEEIIACPGCENLLVLEKDGLVMRGTG